MRAAALIATTAALLFNAPLLASAQPAEGSTEETAQPSEEDEAEGRQLARDGFAAYKANDYATAVDKFQQARAIYPTGQVLRMTGYSLLALERWLDAAEALEEALGATYKPLDDADRQQTQEQLDKALSHLGSLQIKSSVPGATVRIDERSPQPLPADVRVPPGSHTIIVSAEGRNDAQQTLDIGAGERAALTLDPTEEEEAAPPPPPPPPPPEETEEPGEAWFAHQRLVGGILGGTGLAITVAGVATLVSGSSLRSAVEDNVEAHNTTYGDNCATSDYTACQADAAIINHDGDRANMLRDVGLGLTIGGGTLLALGAVFFFAAPWDEEEGAAEQPAKSGEPEHDAEAARARCGPFGLVGVGCSGTF